MEISQQIDWVIIDDECMIVSYLNNSTLFLNKTATFLWKLFLDKKSIDEIIKICSQYCEQTTVSRQIDDFIKQLINHKIINED